MLPVVTIEGRVVNDPELRFSPSGTAVGSFRLVAQDREKNEQGEWVDSDRILWMPVTCFRNLAENCAESLRKGDLVTVVGRIQTREWEAEGGDKRSRIEMVANSVAASLQFRTITHGGKAERSTEPDPDDPWTGAADPDEPPF